MNDLNKLIEEKRRLIKFNIIDKLDLINSKQPIKNLHIYFYILYYIYDNIDFYYNLLYMYNKSKINKERIKRFEDLLNDMNILWLINDSIVKDEDWIKSIENFDLCYLQENGFI